MANGFQEYPKVMHHPHHQDAVYETLPGKGVGLFVPDTIMRKPERFPSVTVMTKDQEQAYAARGYRPANNPDPQAYEQAILECEPVTGYVNNEYPKWKYHAEELPVIVKDAEEEKALGEGWGNSPIIAMEDDTQNVLAGGKLFTYAAGTANKLATYTDSTGAVPNTNPIILDEPKKEAEKEDKKENTPPKVKKKPGPKPKAKVA